MMTAVMPGFVFLRRPSGGDVGAPFYSTAPLSPSSHPYETPVAPPSRRYVSGVLSVWLEVLSGVRPTSFLARGPFHSRIAGYTQELRALNAYNVSAQLKSFHLQDPMGSAKGYKQEVRFCATILFQDRVRAVAGTFSLRRIALPTPLHEVRGNKGFRRADQWRLETLHLI